MWAPRNQTSWRGSSKQGPTPGSALSTLAERVGLCPLREEEGAVWVAKFSGPWVPSQFTYGSSWGCRGGQGTCSVGGWGRKPVMVAPCTQSKCPGGTCSLDEGRNLNLPCALGILTTGREPTWPNHNNQEEFSRSEKRPSTRSSGALAPRDGGFYPEMMDFKQMSVMIDCVLGMTDCHREMIL